MALRKDLNSIAHGLLERCSKGEIDQLIKVLSYFNQRCAEESRALCLQNGCKNPADAEGALRDVLLEKSGSQDSYLLSKRPVCRCCGR